jgi:hypothetical protein
MIVRAIRASVSLVGLAVIAYVVFFVPLGKRTVYQHLTRIADTEEAKELGREAEEAGGRLGSELMKRMNAEDAAAGDGDRREAERHAARPDGEDARQRRSAPSDGGSPQEP